MSRFIISIALATWATLGMPSRVRAGLCQEEVCVRFDPASTVVGVGDTFSVNIVADMATPVVGWGLDFAAVTPPVVSIQAPPTIGLIWLAAHATDGDGLAGLAFPNSVVGDGVVLATLHLHADTLGQTDLQLSTTLGDLTEGFAKDPSGFATVGFELGHVAVVPEPSIGFALATLALLAMAHGRAMRKK